MRISTLILSGATFGALALTTLPASAAVLSVAQVTNGCPDIDQAQECPILAEEFLSTRPMGPTSDTQIVSLVLAIAELSEFPRVSMQVCLNAADGLRVLASGVSSADQQMQIEDIADALCVDTTTAAIRDRGAADSLSSAGGTSGTGGTGTGTGGAGGNGGDGGHGGGGSSGHGGGDHDNGHGNDADHDDDSNPGHGGGGHGGGHGSGGQDGDNDNGHGNDNDHDDDSNPGRGGGGHNGGRGN